MSSWTILTIRALPERDYKYGEYDDGDHWKATNDIVATMENDDRIKMWTAWKDHVYAYIRSMGFSAAESILEDYKEMALDAVVLTANNTSDLGKARYYPVLGGIHMDEYREVEEVNGYYTGQIALAKMTARHGIIARDPFHNQPGNLDGVRLDEGENRL